MADIDFSAIAFAQVEKIHEDVLAEGRGLSKADLTRLAIRIIDDIEAEIG